MSFAISVVKKLADVVRSSKFNSLREVLSTIILTILIWHIGQAYRKNQNDGFQSPTLSFQAALCIGWFGNRKVEYSQIVLLIDADRIWGNYVGIANQLTISSIVLVAIQNRGGRQHYQLCILHVPSHGA